MSLRRAYSWPLALILLGPGLVVGAWRHLGRWDFERAGSVRTSDGLRLMYETEGRGPPLLALAGGPGVSHHGFHPYLEPLSAAAQVVYFDPRGRGDSDGAAGYQVADDVRDVETLRRGLGHGQLDLLGVSYGAHLAAAYALEHPQAVRKLVLVSPIVGARVWRSHLRALARAPGMSEILSGIRRDRGDVRLSERTSLERIAPVILPLYWCDARAARRATSVFRPRHHLRRQNMDVYEALVGRSFPELTGDLAASTLDERLWQLQAPVLIVQGACDQASPAESVRDLERVLPRARRVVLPNSGHAAFIDDPRGFADEVAGFLGAPS